MALPSSIAMLFVLRRCICAANERSYVARKKKHTRSSVTPAGDAQIETLSCADAVDRYSSARKRKSRFKKLRVVLIVILVLILGVGGAAFAYIADINARVSDVDSSIRSSLTQVEDGEPFYMLLLGVDKSQDRVNSDEYGAEESAYRSDSIMLARIDPGDKKVTLVSIHRDTLIDMGEWGNQKINAAYGIGYSMGDPGYVIDVVSEFAGVPISHYAELDFEGFISIVDTIGGIEVDVPVRCDDSTGTGQIIEAGKQTLNGEQALVLCRARHAYDDYGDGDVYRAANQRMVIAAIAQKILTLDPATMTTVISQLADSISTDLDVTSIINLATQMRGINLSKDVYSGMEPTNSEYVNDTWYEICDTEAWQEMMTRVNQGLSPYSDESQDVTRGVAGSVGSISDDGGSKSDTNNQQQEPENSLEYGGTVQVLNGAGVDGLASRISSSLANQGFDASAGNADYLYDYTIIIYNGEDHKSQAEAVNEALGGSFTVEANDGTYSTDYDVVLILGSDMSDE